MSVVLLPPPAKSATRLIPRKGTQMSTHHPKGWHLERRERERLSRPMLEPALVASIHPTIHPIPCATTFGFGREWNDEWNEKAIKELPTDLKLFFFIGLGLLRLLAVIQLEIGRSNFLIITCFLTSLPTYPIARPPGKLTTYLT